MKAWINMSSPQEHPTSALPKALYDLYYRRHTGLLTLINSSGYPHNGGQHTLGISGERADVTAWLDLFKEEYPDCGQEVDILKKKLHTEFVKNPSGSVTIKLSDIERQHGYNGELVTRRWFWVPSWEENKNETNQ